MKLIQPLCGVLLAAACSEPDPIVSVTPSLEIAAFDVAEAGFGEAPYTVHFVWSIEANDGPLTCELDWNGDGQSDVVQADCAANTVSASLAELPAATFVEPGEYHPRLRVRGATLERELTTTIYANFVVLAPGAIAPETLPGFLSAELSWANPVDYGQEAPHVVLTFASEDAVPEIPPGTVVIGAGFLMEVQTSTRSGPTLSLDGVDAPITAAIQDAFVGARDVVHSFADARCPFEACAGVSYEALAPGEEPYSEYGEAAAAPGKSLAALLVDGKGAFGGKLKLPSTSSDWEHTLFVGMVVKKFVLEIERFDLKQLDVDIEPTVKYEINVTGSLVKLDPAASIGPIPLGVIPILPPVVMLPVTLNIDLRLAVDIKLGATAEAKMPFKLKLDYATGALTGSVAPQLDAKADLQDGVTGSAKISLVPRVEAGIPGVGGPYVAPVFSLTGEAKAKQGVAPTTTPNPCPSEWVVGYVPPSGDVLCLGYKFSLGGEAWFHATWLEKITKKFPGFKKLEITVAEIGKEPCWGRCVDTSVPGADVISVSDSVSPSDTSLAPEAGQPDLVVLDTSWVATPDTTAGSKGLTAECFEGTTVAVSGSHLWGPAIMHVKNVTKVPDGLAGYATVLEKPEVGDQSAHVPPDATVFTFGDASLLTGVPGLPDFIFGRQVNRLGRSNLIAVWNNPTTGDFEWMFNVSAGHYSFTNELAVHRQFQFIFDSRKTPAYRFKSYGSSDGLAWKPLDDLPYAAVVSLPKPCFQLAQLQVTPTQASFGGVATGGTSAALTFAVTNVGGTAAGVPAAAVTGADASDFSIASETCSAGGPLAAGASCTVSLTFAPEAGAPSGPRSASLEVSSTIGGSDSAVLHGVGLSPGLEVTPSVFDFGAAFAGFTSADQTFVVKNSGTGPTGALDFSLSGDPDFQQNGGSCVSGAVLQPGQSCTALVRLAAGATALMGSRAGALVTTDGATVASASLLGAVHQAAALSLLPGTHDFGNVSVGVPAPTVLFTVTNGVGSVPAGPLAFTVTGPDAAAFAVLPGATCVPGVTTLLGGASCTIEIGFTPTSGGARSAALAITAVPGGMLSAPLTGTGK